MHVTKRLLDSRPITLERCLTSKNPSSAQPRIVFADAKRDASILSPPARIDTHVTDLLAPLTPLSTCIRLRFRKLLKGQLRRIRMLIKARYSRSLAPSPCQLNRIIWVLRLCQSCYIQFRNSLAQFATNTNIRIPLKQQWREGRNLC